MQNGSTCWRDGTTVTTRINMQCRLYSIATCSCVKIKLSKIKTNNEINSLYMYLCMCSQQRQGMVCTIAVISVHAADEAWRCVLRSGGLCITSRPIFFKGDLIRWLFMHRAIPKYFQSSKPYWSITCIIHNYMHTCAIALTTR